MKAIFFTRTSKKSRCRDERLSRGYFFWLNVWLLAINAYAAPFVAYVDKTEIDVGNSFTLTLEYQDKISDQPDFSPLEKDFTILSQKTSTQSTYVNGAYQGKTRFILEIEPKSEKKELVIPAIKLGKHMTSAIRVTQSDKPVQSKNNSKDIGLFVTVDRPEVYVNGELILHIEIKTPLSLQNGTINKPEIEGAIMETLAEDKLQEVVEDGIKYFVFNRSYAVFRSRPGKLVIPPLTFKGMPADLRIKSDPLSGFFSGGKRITARSAAIDVMVKDVPPSFPKDQPFLPLKSLLVIESFDEADPSFAVNKATTRRFEIKARGTLASFLPVIVAPTVDNVQIYAEAGNKIQKNIDDDFESSVKVSHVYMPTAPGKAFIPEQVIYWWDTDSDELRTANIRSLTFEIAPGPEAVPPKETPEAINTPAAPDTEQKKEEGVEPKSSWSRVGVWQILALIFLALWLFTMALFFRRQKIKNAHDHVQEGQEKNLQDYIKDIVAACDADNAKKAYRALQSLREWAKRHEKTDWLDNTMGPLQRELEASLFEKDRQDDTRAVLLGLKNHIRQIKIAKTDKSELLPLYPQ